MSRFVTAAVVMVLLLSPLANAAVKVNEMAKQVPAESMLAIFYDGDNKDAKDTALNKILDEPEVKALLDGPLDGLWQKTVSDQMQKQNFDLNTLLPLKHAKIAFAFLGMAPGASKDAPPAPEGLFVIKVGASDSPLAASAVGWAKAAAKKEGLAEFQPTKVAGVDAFSGSTAKQKFTYCVTGGFFYYGTGSAVEKTLTAQNTKLDAAPEFVRASELSGGNETLLVYLNYAEVLQRFGLFVPPDAMKQLKNPELGIDNLKTLSFSITPDGKGYNTSLFLQMPGGLHGLVKAMAGGPLDPKLAELAPEDCGYFLGMSIEPAELWDIIISLGSQHPAKKAEIEKNLADARTKLSFDLRKDFLASIGSQTAVFGPGFTVAVQLRDPAKFRLCLDTMFHKIAESARSNPDTADAELHLASMNHNGRTMYFADGKRLPLVIQPSFVMDGNYAVFSLWPLSTKKYIDSMKEDRLTDVRDFKRLRSRFGKDIASLYYSDTAKVLEQGYDWLPFMMGAMKAAKPEDLPVVPDSALIPTFDVIKKHLFGSMAVTRVEKDGVLLTSYSPLGMPAPPPVNMSNAAVPAVLAGMLLPAMGHAQAEELMVGKPSNRAMEEARKVRDGYNLKQIGTAANTWLTGIGNGTYYPPSLRALRDEGILREPKVFISPLGNTQVPPNGGFVTDYECILDMVGHRVSKADVSADLPLAWDKKGLAKDVRNVVFFDSHVEFLSEESFQKLMTEKIQPWVRKMRGEGPPAINVPASRQPRVLQQRRVMPGPIQQKRVMPLPPPQVPVPAPSGPEGELPDQPGL